MILGSNNDLNTIQYISRDVGMDDNNGARSNDWNRTDNETMGFPDVRRETELFRITRP
jgi:hypothetical protein